MGAYPMENTVRDKIPEPFEETQGPEYHEDGSKLIHKQERVWQKMINKPDGTKYRLLLIARFEDSANLGRGVFTITAERLRPRVDLPAPGPHVPEHEELAIHFPWIRPYLKWHGFTSKGPSNYQNYISNTIWLASDRDCWGLRKGEAEQIRNGKTGKPVWVLEADKELPKYVESDDQPREVTTLRYVPMLRFGEGKERDLEGARRVAIWPDAPESILTAEPEKLKAALIERLPMLKNEFKRDMEALGFVYPNP